MQTKNKIDAVEYFRQNHFQTTILIWRAAFAL